MTEGAVELRGRLDIQRAQEAAETLLAALQNEGEIVLDLSAVTGADVAGLQVLVGLQRSATARGRSLRVRGPVTAELRQHTVEAGFSREGGTSQDTKCFWMAAD